MIGPSMTGKSAAIKVLASIYNRQHREEFRQMQELFMVRKKLAKAGDFRSILLRDPKKLLAEAA